MLIWLAISSGSAKSSLKATSYDCLPSSFRSLVNSEPNFATSFECIEQFSSSVNSDDDGCAPAIGSTEVIFCFNVRIHVFYSHAVIFHRRNKIRICHLYTFNWLLRTREQTLFSTQWDNMKSASLPGKISAYYLATIGQVTLTPHERRKESQSPRQRRTSALLSPAMVSLSYN